MGLVEKQKSEPQGQSEQSCPIRATRARRLSQRSKTVETRSPTKCESRTCCCLGSALVYEKTVSIEGRLRRSVKSIEYFRAPWKAGNEPAGSMTSANPSDRLTSDIYAPAILCRVLSASSACSLATRALQVAAESAQDLWPCKQSTSRSS